MAAVMLRQRIERTMSPEELAGPAGHWLPADVGVHYTGVAGLLNLLVILDAVARGDRGSSSRRHPHQVPAPSP
jgi:hypothetical protein